VLSGSSIVGALGSMARSRARDSWTGSVALLDQAAYRILREALTNAARYGDGAARVGLAFGERAVELTISNAAPREGGPRANGGHGLVGMRERASVLGGSLEVERGRLLLRPSLSSLHRCGRMTRVLIADDDGLMRAGLVELLPDVVLMDVRMPDLDGIGATRELTFAAPGARVLILPTFEQDDYVFGALRAGASGFLLKRSRPEELIAAVHTVAAGESLLSPSVTRRVIDRMAQQPVPEVAAAAKLEALTRREREVLELIARGLSNREIATQLFVEESTVRTHVKRIQMKLALRDRVQIVIFAYETGVNRPAPGATATR
jgi:DNA-binding NarL/FixJ family response regulator